MHFFKALLVGASAFAVATAQLAFTSVPNSVTAGQSYTITYSGGSGSVTVLLRKGAASDLKTIATISSGATGGSFTWTPDASLPNGADYALQITSGSETNYGGPITLTGGAASGSISASASASASSTSTGSVSTVTASVTANSTMTMSNSTVTASTISGNSTISSATLKTTTSVSVTTTAAGATKTTGASSTGATTAPSNAANSVIGLSSSSSPLAFVFCVLAGMLYLN